MLLWRPPETNKQKTSVCMCTHVCVCVCAFAPPPATEGLTRRDEERLGLLGPLGGLCATLGPPWARLPTLVVRGSGGSMPVPLVGSFMSKEEERCRSLLTSAACRSIEPLIPPPSSCSAPSCRRFCAGEPRAGPTGGERERADSEL